MRRDAASQREAAQQIIALGEVQGSLLRGVGKAFHAAAVAAAGAGATGLAEISDGLAQMAATGYQAGAPALLAELDR